MTHHLSSTIKPLLGKKLLRFEINDPAKIFFTDGTEVTVNITGDCCSTSIIYDVIQENNPHGTELIDVIEYDTSAAMPNAVEIAKSTGTTKATVFLNGTFVFFSLEAQFLFVI